MGIKSVILEAVQRLNEKKVALVNALLFPALVYIGLNILDISNDNPKDPSPFIMVTGLLSFLLSVIMAITIHRVIFLEDASITKWDAFKWTKRETTFALYAILLGIFIMVSLLPIVLFIKVMPLVSFGLSAFFMTFVLSRLSLVFPGIALDHEISFRRSMELTKDHQLLMVFVVMILPLLFMLPAIPLFVSVRPEGMNAFYVSYFLLVYALSAVCTITTLSVTYKQILLENEKRV
jgi:hypothetical protein